MLFSACTLGFKSRRRQPGQVVDPSEDRPLVGDAEPERLGRERRLCEGFRKLSFVRRKLGGVLTAMLDADRAERFERQRVAEERREQQGKADEVVAGHGRDPDAECLAAGGGDRAHPALARSAGADDEQPASRQGLDLAVDLAAGDTPKLPDRALEFRKNLPAGERFSRQQPEDRGGGGIYGP